MSDQEPRKLEPTQKNQGQSSPDSPGSSAPKYDYSHLQDEKRKGHWYNTPSVPSGNAQVYPSPAAPVPQQPVNPPQPPPPPQQPIPPIAPQSSVPPQSQPVAPVFEPGKGGRARQRIDGRRRRRASGMPENWAWVVIASALLGLTIIGSMFLVFVIRYAIHNDGEAMALESRPEPTSVIYSGEGTEVGGALEGNDLEILQKKWDGQERFTILLLGLDKRPSEEGRYFRTDTMILLSLDPKTNSIGILSIPRDTYVEIPYAGLDRVNTAYVVGELEAAGGGPRMAMQTIQYNFGIRVHEYVTFDFETVIAIIDAIGGIDINVESYIYDPEYPTMDFRYEVLEIQPGWQHMDGALALKYARTRHQSNDIDRAARQQQVMFAARDRVISLDMLDDLVTQAPMIYGEINEGVSTGLSLDQMISLLLWAKDVPPENIRTGVVNYQYLMNWQTDSGAQVLIPNRYILGNLMIEVFGPDYGQ